MRRRIMIFFLILILIGINIVFSSTSDTVDAQANISNNPPLVFNVTSAASINPNDGATVEVENFIVEVEDLNGYPDLNMSATYITLTKTGEETRSNATCRQDENMTDTLSRLNCTVTMLYYDSAGDWNINATVTDNGGAENSNTTQTYTYGTLSAIQIPETAIEWTQGIVAGDEDKLADSNITINNTGNQDFSTINVTGYVLMGQDDASHTLSNFSVNITNSCEGTQLLNGTASTVGGASLSHGPEPSLTLLFFCLESVPSSISAQVYNTTNSTPWRMEAII